MHNSDCVVLQYTTPLLICLLLSLAIWCRPLLHRRVIEAVARGRTAIQIVEQIHDIDYCALEREATGRVETRTAFELTESGGEDLLSFDRLHSKTTTERGVAVPPDCKTASRPKNDFVPAFVLRLGGSWNH